MIIEWIGHSCFRITTKSGLSLVTDPFDTSVGYDRPTTKADIACVSHNHHDHNDTTSINPSLICREAVKYCYKDTVIDGFSTFHDEVKGQKRGTNVIFRIKADGQTIVHLGDLGCSLTNDEANALYEADCLLVPVGGVYTIDAPQAVELIRQIKPKAIIPMHYQTEKLSFELASLQTFLDLTGDCPTSVDRVDLDDSPRGVVIMNYGWGL